MTLLYSFFASWQRREMAIFEVLWSTWAPSDKFLIFSWKSHIIWANLVPEKDLHARHAERLEIIAIRTERAVFNWVSKIISELLSFCIYFAQWLVESSRAIFSTNRCLRAHIFPRFASATCNYFEFWLVCWIVSVLFDWPK